MTKSNRKGVREDVPLHLMPKLKLAVNVFVVTLGVLLWFMPILIWIVSSPVPWFAFDDGYGNAQSFLQWHSGYNMDGLRTTAATTTAVKESPDVVSKPEPVNDDRPRAAMISLVRNSDLDLVLRSMRQLETRWNARYRYPWVFFSDEPLSREFKDATSNATFAACYYEVVPQEHWSVPDWIDGDMFNRSLEYLKQIGVHNKGSMDDASYRHLKARWHSGFFYKHPRMQEFDWYWRVKPDAQFYGNIDYDVFRFMRDNGMKYGHGSSMDKILGYNARSAPSLLWRTRSFMDVHPELIHPEADLDWLLLDREPQSRDNNKRQFSSNVEIGDLHFFRGEQHGRYFEWLDRSGGFFYEFPGDAAVRALSAAMFLPKRQVWFLGDVGCQYRVDGACPRGLAHRCEYEPTHIDEHFGRFVPAGQRQKKPADTCQGDYWPKKGAEGAVRGR